jgi:hypothetical protein
MKLIGAQLAERLLPRLQFRDLINGVIRYAIDRPGSAFRISSGLWLGVLECSGL